MKWLDYYVYFCIQWLVTDALVISGTIGHTEEYRVQYQKSFQVKVTIVPYDLCGEGVQSWTTLATTYKGGQPTFSQSYTHYLWIEVLRCEVMWFAISQHYYITFPHLWSLCIGHEYPSIHSAGVSLPPTNVPSWEQDLFVGDATPPLGVHPFLPAPGR